MANQHDFGILKILRRKHNLTLQSLAKNCGLTYATVAGIETNKTSPSLKTIVALAGQFGMSASQFLVQCEKPNLIIKTAQTMHDTQDQEGILGLDKCQNVAYGNIRFIRATASAGQVIQGMPLHPDVLELCYVLSGRTCLTYNSREYILSSNESIFFDAIQNHSYSQIEDGQFAIVYIPKSAQTLSSAALLVSEPPKNPVS